MADGKITIDVGVNGKGVKGLKNDLDDLEGKSKKAGSGIDGMVKAIGAVKIASVAFNVLKNSMDAAISRFDTFQRFPKVMQSFGYTTKDSKLAMDDLSKGIEGLPTKLDDVVATTQRMTSMTGNLKQSTQVTLALNNAFLASGSSAEDAKRGTEQYIQQLAKGEVDLESWRTLQETMSVGLQRVAENMGFAGEAATTDLYEALKSGKVTFRDFQKELIRIGTGTGELAELAKTNSEGIATSFSNLKNAAAKGLANLITVIDELSVKVTGNNIAQNIDRTKVIINSAFDSVGRTIKTLTPIVKILFDAFSGVVKIVNFLSPAIIGLGAAFGALKTIQTAQKAIGTLDAIMIAAAWSGKTLTIVTAKQTAAQTANTVATKADTAVRLANNGVITIGTALMGVLTGSISASTVATALATKGVVAFKAGLTFLTGPIGLVVTAVGGLVAGGIALFKWWNKDSEAAIKLNDAQSELKNSTDELISSTNTNISTRSDDVKYAESTQKAYRKLAEETELLANKQNRSAGETKLLKDNIAQLNSNVDGLNLSYDKENNQLNLNTEAINKRIEAFSQQEKANQLQEQLVQNLEEQYTVESKLEEISTLRDDWNKKLEDGSVKTREASKATEELDNQEKVLIDTQNNLKTEYESAKQAQIEASDAVAQAVQDGVYKQTISFDELSDSQQTTVENMRSVWQSYSENATNMFDTLSDKQTVSITQMQANLEENQRVIGSWSENIALLAQKGVDEGLLNTLRNAGPESAGYVATLVGSTDVELSKLNDTFKNGGDVAVEALRNAFGLGAEEIPNDVMSMVTSAEVSLKEQVEAADFGSVGKSITDGLAEGINHGTGDATKAVSDTAKATKEQFTGDMGINSPSRVFKEYGTHLIDGLVLGIKNGNGKVTSSMSALKRIFDSAFKSINQNIAQSMTTYTSKVTASMNQTNSKVNQVTSSMKSTFDRFNNQLNASSATAMNSYANTIKSGFNKANSEMIVGVGKLENVSQKLKNTLPNQAKLAMDSFNKQIDSGNLKAVSAVKSGNSKIVSAYSNLKTELYSSGVYAAQGLAKGIDSQSGYVVSVAKSLADKVSKTIEKALDIHSPSRVTKQLGVYTGEGFAIGISSTKNQVANSAKALTKAFNDQMSKAKYKFNMGQINSDQYIKELRSIRSEYAKTGEQTRKVNLEINRVQTKTAKELAALQKKNFTEALKTIKDKASANKISTAQELTQLQSLAKQYKKNSSERLQIEKEIVTVKKRLAKEQEELLKKQFDKEKAYIAKKKDLNQLSLTDELKLYEKYLKSYKKGSDQRVYWEEQVASTKKQIHEQLLSINEEYTNKILEANKQMEESEKALNEAYEKALEDRAKSLYSFVGIFDEVKKDAEVSGQQLLNNLMGQVSTFEEWTQNIASLTGKGIDDGLLDELKALGPNAASQIAALNTLSDEQLTQYVELWRKKHELAKQQATTELEGMRQDTATQIEELHKETAKQLDAYKKEWASKIKEISKGTKNEFNAMTASMNQIGKNTIQGLMAGMDAMTGPLLAKAQSIANSIAATMKSALSIHSPSRVMRDEIGRFIPQGIAQGIEKDADLVDKAMLGLIKLPRIKAESLIQLTGKGAGVINNNTRTINNQPQVTMNVTWKGKEDIRRTMEKMSWIVNVDETGGLT